jgi:hypothetical protein
MFAVGIRRDYSERLSGSGQRMLTAHTAGRPRGHRNRSETPENRAGSHV